MRYERHYIQFNDLVFDEFDNVTEGDYDISFKSSSTDYGFAHGAYMNLKGSLLAKPGSVALTLIFDLKRLPCDKRQFMRKHVISQLSQPGKLWAVQDNTIIWAHAILSNISEPLRRRPDTIEVDVNFIIPEGVWHKADKQRTFVLPYDICDIFDCYDYQEFNPCGDCCDCEQPINADTDCCECDCNKVREEDALCLFDDIKAFYACYNNYRLVYDCEAAERFNSSMSYYIGTKISGECGVIVGRFYSDTDIDTTDVRIKIHGEMKDPYIEINGNGNIIKGEYKGTLIINPDGSVYAGPNDNELCLVPAENWVVPEGMEYGWVVHPGYNRIKIETNVCCGNPVAYIDVGALTY